MGESLRCVVSVLGTLFQAAPSAAEAEEEDVKEFHSALVLQLARVAALDPFHFREKKKGPLRAPCSSHADSL